MKTLKKPTRGGKREGAGRPKLPAGQARVQIHPMVKPGTIDRLAALGWHFRDADGALATPGEVIDRLVEAAHPQPADE